MNDRINETLKKIIHPESGTNIVDSGTVESFSHSDDSITVVLSFRKNRDPFINSIKRQIREELIKSFPHISPDNISITVKQDEKSTQNPETVKSSCNIKNIIAIASGKGGVGKSVVTANLAVILSEMGYKTGILDADIYGPSQPIMFDLEKYVPAADIKDGKELMIPAEKNGIRIMSIGFFIQPDDALVWRGPMATNALRQLIHQTDWGKLDFLLIDLPPGTGDVHLTILQEFNVDGAVIVSTPHKVATADVLRGIEMFRSDKIKIPVLGIIENMSWFTPDELPENRYYIFGKGGAEALAEKTGIPFLGNIPLLKSVMDGSESGEPGVCLSGEVKKYYQDIAEKIVKNL